MLKKFPSKILSFLPQIIASLFLAGFVAYAWTEPGSAPPAGNVPAPINVGATSQTFVGSKTLNLNSLGSGSLLLHGLLNVTRDAIFDANVGIGTATPGAKLDVQGDIKATSLINSGGVSFPAGGCSASNRGQQWLLQSGAGIEDGFYICKKKVDGSYAWIALGSPEVVTLIENMTVSSPPTFGCSGISGGTFLYTIPSDADYVIVAGSDYRPTSGWLGTYCYSVHFSYPPVLNFSIPFAPFMVGARTSMVVPASGGGTLTVNVGGGGWATNIVSAHSVYYIKKR